VSWNEDSIHRWLGRALPSVRGNDAAVLASALRAPVVCVDQTVEGVHYERGTAAAKVGRKACARALSDLAASGATPRAVVVAMTLGRDVEERWIRGVLTAIARTAAPHAQLVGGDLSATRKLGATLAVTALGEKRYAGPPVARDRARAGHVLVLTGPVGGSPLGRHLRPEPRVAQGLQLASLGARAMMDTSDGLALDLARLARASKVRIDLERVPIHRDARRLARRTGRSALRHALTDGEDYELLATLPRGVWGRLRGKNRGVLQGVVEVGRVRAGSGLWVPRSEARGPLVRWSGARGGGWVHGS
jgi:thiamine-monophosphate kinase